MADTDLQAVRDEVAKCFLQGWGGDEVHVTLQKDDVRRRRMLDSHAITASL